MIGVTSNSPSQINAALIALKGEVKNEVKNEIINNIDNSVIGETYTAGDGIDITNAVISQTTDQLTFTGTQAQWEALTSAEQAKYGLVNRTDNNKGVYKNNNGTLEQIAVGIDDNTASATTTYSSQKIETLITNCKAILRSGQFTVTSTIAMNGYYSKDVTFDTPMPDANYLVELEVDGGYWHVANIHTSISQKTANGFRVLIGNPSTVVQIPANNLIIKYTAFKLFT